jgi:uncharacterized protein
LLTEDKNRMTLVAWRSWGEEAFALAQAQEKPVLLSITASWCQFCAAMDENTYGNEALAQYVNDNFVPVRIDSDKRPDVNARYSQGGWPSTCVLTGDGDILWGGTSLSPDQMAQLLPQVLNSYRTEKPQIAQHVQGLREQIRQQHTPPPLDPNLGIDPSLPLNVLLGAKFEFDFAFGGFGHNGQKFPQTDVIELVMEQYSRSLQAEEPDGDLKLILERTLVGIASGGLCDSVDGGYFRYAQTPDWRNPQFEKLLEDNALLLRVFSRAFALLSDARWKTAADNTFGYLKTHLWLEEKGVFGGSQFADGEYYGQPVEERKEWNPPAVDETVLTGPNAQAVRGLVAYWQATGNAEALPMACKTMDYLLAHLVSEGGVVARFESGDASEAVPSGMLADAADLVAACLDLYETAQGVSYLDRGEEIATWSRGHLEDPVGGALFDAPVRPDALGNLKVGTKDITDNMQMADALLRLFLATGETEHAQLAQRILQAFQPAAPQMGFFGSVLALVVERAILPPVLVHVVGPKDDPRTHALLKAAHTPYRYERFVQPLDPSNEDDAAHLENLGYPIPEQPTAHTLVATDPRAPTIDPETLIETIKNATAS